jgi:hypothetical protein
MVIMPTKKTQNKTIDSLIVHSLCSSNEKQRVLNNFYCKHILSCNHSGELLLFYKNDFIETLVSADTRARRVDPDPD